MVAGGGAVEAQPKLAREASAAERDAMAAARCPTAWAILACCASTAEAGGKAAAEAGKGKEGGGEEDGNGEGPAGGRVAA